MDEGDPAGRLSSEPGTAALFVLLRKVTADKVLEGLKGEGGTVLEDLPRSHQGRSFEGGTCRRAGGGALSYDVASGFEPTRRGRRLAQRGWGGFGRLFYSPIVVEPAARFGLDA